MCPASEISCDESVISFVGDHHAQTVPFNAGEEDENIKVYLRIKPENDNDHTGHHPAPSLLICKDDPNSVMVAQDTFTFDAVGSPSTPQEWFFDKICVPLCDNCIDGYNATIFAYGQTGSGKTFTMQGPLNDDGSLFWDERGLIPRTLEYLFARIGDAGAMGSSRSFSSSSSSAPNCSYTITCSFIEIYNENVYDLLSGSQNSSTTTCQLRENEKRGVYVEGCREIVCESSTQALQIFESGSQKRHVAATRMNHESSRSHSIFTLTITGRLKIGSVQDVRVSKFNLVDLAGSERQSATGNQGVRLREAGNINKSLLTLGGVINSLVEIAGGRRRHVHYRDSKLTFLLRDSLGGNSKTSVIATVNGTFGCQAETLSTLKFATRTKQIRNKAKVNKDVEGNLAELQSEVKRLQEALEAAVHGNNGNREGNMMMHAATHAGEGFSMEMGESTVTDAICRESLKRQQGQQKEIAELERELQMLRQQCEQRDRQSSSHKMQLKFRDSTITALNKKVKILQQQLEEGGGEAETSERLQLEMDTFESERAQLKNDYLAAKSAYEHHPEITKLAFENQKLSHQLALLQDSEAIFDGLNERIGQLEEFQDKVLFQFLEQDIPFTQITHDPKRRKNSGNGNDGGAEEHQSMMATLHENIAGFKAEIEHLQRTNDDQNERLVSLTEKCNQLADDLQSERNLHLQAQESLKLLKDTHKAQVETLEHKHNHLINTRNDQIKSLNNELSTVGAQLKSMQAQNHSLSLQIEKMEKDHSVKVDGLTSQINQMHGHLEEYSPIKGLDIQELLLAKQSAEELRLSNTQLSLQLSDHQRSLQTSAEAIEQLRILKEDLTRQLADLTATRNHQTQEIDSLHSEILHLRNENDKMIQHGNTRQKLQYHFKIKEENNKFKQEIFHLKEQLLALQEQQLRNKH